MHNTTVATLAGWAVVFTLVGCGQPSVPSRVDSPFKMERDSFAFANFVKGYDESVVDAEAMRRMFGDQVCTTGSSPCQLSSGARAFMRDANASMTGGRCEGFAVLSSLFASEQLNAEDFGAPTPRQLSLDGNTALQRELAYWFSTQLVPKAVAEKTEKYLAKDVMPALAKALDKDATERVRIGIVRKRGNTITGGHSLTPLGYYRDPENEAVYWVRVYDNNRPDAERLLKVDTKENRWEFEASENPETRSRLYFGDESNQNPLYLAPILSRQGELPCPFCEEGGGQVVSRGGAQIVVDLPEGPVGVIEGKLVSSANAFITPAFSTPLDSEAASYLIGLPPGATSGDLTVRISPTQDPENPNTQQEVSITGEQVRALVRNLLVTSEDTFRTSPTGSTFVNASRSDVEMQTEVQVNDRTVSVTAHVTGGSDQVRANVDPSSGQVKVGVTGATGADVTVVVSSTGQDGNASTSQLTFTSNGDSELTADTSSLTGSGTLSGSLENGGATTPLNDGCTDGAQSGAESDVDCGQVCSRLCTEGQACLTATDCDTGLCHATLKLCVSNACSDGARSTGETDVDCGGTSCGACALNKGCGGNGDCASGACSGGVCVNTYSLGVAVSGLPLGDALTLANGGDTLTVNGDGTFTFPTRITSGYSVSITTQPQNASCAISGGAGTATADVTNVVVSCTSGFAISGTLSGLGAGKSIVLSNGAEQLTVNGDGAFSFLNSVSGAYDVQVDTDPVNQSCTVTNGSGTATADVTNVQVACVDTYQLSGTVSGLAALEQAIVVNGSDFVPLFADGAFSFPTRVTGSYSVSVNSSPAGKSCTVTNGSGIATADVTNIAVVCTVATALDTTFNGTGYLRSSESSGPDRLFDGIVNTDSTLVMVGEREVTPGDTEWVLLKVLNDGTPDSNFGTSGTSYFGKGAGPEAARRVFRDGTGYIVVGSLRGTFGLDVGIARFNANGSSDTAFGNTGSFEVDLGQEEVVESAARDSMGRYIVVGRTSATGAAPHNVFVARLGVDGTLDTTFGTGGVFTWDGGGDEGAVSVVIDPATQDLLVLAQNGIDALVLRVIPNTGALDNSFGTAGVATVDLSGANRPDFASRIAVSQGNIIVSGTASGATTADLAVAQLNAAGALDTAFGSQGRLLIDRGGAESGYALVAAPTGGGFYVGGRSNNNLLIAKVTAAGAVDTTFGQSGFFENTLGSSAICHHLMTDNVDRLVAVGAIHAAGIEDLGVARIQP